MSGLYLIVTDGKYTDSEVLKLNSTGYPHITVCYTGKNLNERKLTEVAALVWGNIMASGDLKTVRLTEENVRLNSFFHERQNRTRYDVLLNLDKDGEQFVTALRDIVVREVQTKDIVSMNQPHITHSIHWTEAEAKAAFEKVKTHLPIDVTITGYTIK